MHSKTVCEDHPDVVLKQCKCPVHIQSALKGLLR